MTSPKPSRTRKRTEIKVWVGIDLNSDDICTWSTARSRNLCVQFLQDVYSIEEVHGKDIKISRATLTLSKPPVRGKGRS